MRTHAEIKAAVARALADSEDIRSYCVREFGRGALVIVDWYGAEGAPGEAETPYIFLYSTGENTTGHVGEETFEFSVEIGAVANGINAPVREEEVQRTAEANGLTLNGCAAKIEALRSIIIGIIKTGVFGAALRTVTISESSTLSYPLEWASIRCEFFEPETITP